MKYSKQRELIFDYVKKSFFHPNAMMVYDYARKYIPNISLGTVYRNLQLLSETGLIKKIPTPDDNLRFDKIENPHSHIYCRNCNEILDITSDQFTIINDVIANETGHVINPNYTVLVGICNNCLKKKGN